MIKTPLSTMMGGAFWTPSTTIIGSTSKTLNQIIKSIFANNEQGFAHDPNDLSAMYQDYTGVTSVTSHTQPIGLSLDTSKGAVRGLEIIVPNWTFSSARVSESNGVISFASALVGADYVENNGVVVVGKWYEAIFTVYDFVVGGASLSAAGLITPVVAQSNGIYRQIFRATASGKIRVITRFGTTTLKINGLSVKEVSGNHAYQSTTSQRPIYRDNPKRVDYDGVDDNLITTLPAQLTNCTVIRAVPSVGTQILTGQTIPITYTDNIDHCGLIVINRVLTSAEISQITKLFNKAAGV